MAGATTRQRYVDAVVQHILAVGHAEMSLVALAEAAETSDRMLVYYFKTREALLTEAINNIRRNQRRALAAALTRLSQNDTDADLQQILRAFCSDDNAGIIRLFYDAAGRGFRDEAPFGEYLQGVLRDTIDEATQAASRLGVSDTNAQTFGTLFAALANGLGCDRQATRDEERIDRSIMAAAKTLVAQLKSDPNPE